MMVDGMCSKTNTSGKLEIHFGRTAAASCVSSGAFNFTVRLCRLSCATISCVTISCEQVASFRLQSNLQWRVAGNSWTSVLFRRGPGRSVWGVRILLSHVFVLLYVLFYQ